MKFIKNNLGRTIYIIFIIGIFIGMIIHVVDTKENLETLKMELVEREKKEYARQQNGKYEPSRGSSTLSSHGVHVWSAYLMAIPYIIVEFVLIILYIVRYHT